MATFTSQHPDLIDPNLKRVFFQEYMMEPERFSEVFTVESSNKAWEDAMKVSGLGALATKAEGEPISYSDPVSGAVKRVVHSTYALGFRVTMEMRQDDQFGIMSRMPSDLGFSTRAHREQLAWSVLNNGGTSTTGTLDGLALFSTAHPYLKSQGTDSDTVQANDLSPAVSLSVAGLESIKQTARTVRDESGRFTPQRGELKHLIIPPALEDEAQRLLESEFEPYTSDNQINTMKSSRSGMAPKVVPYLTDAETWFVAADKRNHGLKFYNRIEPETDQGMDFDTRDQKFVTFYRASACARDWRGIYRSAP